MNIKEVLENIPYTGSGNTDVKKIEFDSRKAESGTLFVCLRGARVDGHDFAEMAYKNGCRLFLCEEQLELPEDCLQFITDDTRAALARASANFYRHPARELKIIGITGTKGKTTTALLITEILNRHGKKCAYIGSNGVMINGKITETANTTPESHVLHHFFRLMVDAGVKYVALEVSSQALSHNRVDGIDFDTVVFTNLGEDHISPVEHPTLEHYRDSKKRLFTSYNAKNAVYNADDSIAEYMLDSFNGNRISFAMEADADFRGINKSIYREKTSLGVAFELLNEGENIPCRLMTPGAFSIYNGLAAIAVCSIYGVEAEDSVATLAHTPVQGRFEIVEAEEGKTFVVDYSHNGLSLTKALTTLREYNPNKLICVFGSVGGKSEGRRKELALAASEYADYSIITSDNPDFEDADKIISEIAAEMKKNSKFECITFREDAIKRAVEISNEGDIILFAGKGHETYQLICGKKIPFRERELIIKECKLKALVK